MKETSGDMTDWEAVGQYDLQNAARHEAGHAVLCEHFGVFWQLSRFEATRATEDERGVIAQISHSRLSPFRLAVMAWGGILAEMRFKYSRMNPVPDWEEIRWDCWEAHLENKEMGWDYLGLSATDLRGIEGTPFRMRACKTAARILERRWKRVEELSRDFLSRVAHTQQTST